MMAPTPARNIAILGATGSIGASALDVIARHPERFAVVALTANRQWKALFDLVCRFKPRYAAMLDVDAAGELDAALRAAGLATRVLAGPDGLCAIAALPEADTVIAAIVGATGLQPTLAAAKSGKRILLANKETLVLAGKLFIAALRDGGSTLLPIDSEHNAIFQCLPSDRACGEAARGVRRILLTASGGPFRSTPHNELSGVTPEQACAHPTWRMGRKISVDSATMMNKGLEVIEARWLFGVAADAIDVVIHPQSIVHSLVEYVDGSVLAQLGNPDMRTPIAQALAWPERIAAGVAPLDLAGLGALDFAAPEAARFPCLGLAYDALRADGTAPAMLNAANEVAVAAFLEHRIRFTQIAAVCEETMSRLAARPLTTLDEALNADREARALTRQLLELDQVHTVPA